LRVRLAEALKFRRRAAKLSQKAFATTMKSSQSRIAKAEANNHSVSLDLLIRSLIALGVGLKELARIIGFDEGRADLNVGTTNSHPKSKRARTIRSQKPHNQPKQPRKGHKRNNVNAA
jgi:transcriptional regulator with XRE-family HTH domain